MTDGNPGEIGLASFLSQYRSKLKELGSQYLSLERVSFFSEPDPNSPGTLKTSCLKFDEIEKNVDTLIDHGRTWENRLSKYLKDSLDQGPRSHPLSAAVLDISMITGADMTKVCQRYLKKRAAEYHIDFFLYHYLTVYPLLKQFSRKSRRLSYKYQPFLFKCLDKYVINYRKKKIKARNGKKGGMNDLIFDIGEERLRIPAQGPDEFMFLVRRFIFTLVMNRAVVLYFIEDEKHRQSILNSLSELVRMIYMRGGEEYRKIFLLTTLQIAAGEDEEAISHFQVILKQLGEKGNHSIFLSKLDDLPVLEGFYFGKSLLSAGESALEYNVKVARVLCNLSLKLSIQCFNRRETALSMMVLSRVFLDSDDLDLSLLLSDLSRALARSINDPLLITSSHFTSGWAYLENERFRESARFFKKSRSASGKLGDEKGYTEALVGLALISLKVDNRRKAKKFLKEIVFSMPIKQYPNLFSKLKEEVMKYNWLKKDKAMAPMFQGSKKVYLKRTVLIKIISYAKDSYPNEFGAVLHGNEVIENLEILYNTQANRNSVMFSKYDGAGTRISVDGFVHSHPSGGAVPSQADLRSFSLFITNLIIGYPFNDNSIAAYDRVGNRLELEIVEG